MESWLAGLFLSFSFKSDLSLLCSGSLKYNAGYSTTRLTE